MILVVVNGLMGYDTLGFIAYTAKGIQVAICVGKQGAGHIQADGFTGRKHDTGIGGLNTELVDLTGHHRLGLFTVAVASAHQLRTQTVFRAIPANDTYACAEVGIPCVGGGVQFHSKRDR